MLRRPDLYNRARRTAADNRCDRCARCEYDRVDRFWIDRRRFPVPQSQFFRTLKKTAIKKNPAVLRLDQKFGTGNSLSRAQKSKLHTISAVLDYVDSTGRSRGVDIIHSGT